MSSDLWKSEDGSIELRFGDWRRVLRDVSADVLMTDPPFSARTHEGQRSGGTLEPTIDYAPISVSDAIELAMKWNERIAQWVLIFADHIGFAWHEQSWQGFDWKTFAPVAWIKPNPAPRKAADGPTCSVEQIMIARPQGWPTVRGSRPGHYVTPVSSLRGAGMPGAKPVDLMRALVRDYSRPGDLIVDPYAGSATTLLAAAIEGRRAIGCESSRKNFDLAVRRLEAGFTLPLKGIA